MAQRYQLTKECAFEFLPLRTYNVVPLDSERGLIEWCTGTQSLSEFLAGSDKNGGAHKKYCKSGELSVIEARNRYKNMEEKSRRINIELSQWLELFLDVCGKVSPVFRYFFYEKFRNPEIFHKRIQNYTKSLAQWSIGKLINGIYY